MILRNNLIYEDGVQIKYIELRLCLLLDCEVKYKKITKIIDYLHENKYCIDLRLLYADNMRIENLDEKVSIPSVSIDMRDGYLRFKYFNGQDIYWTYHTKDLFDLINENQHAIQDLLDKYQFIIDILNDLRKKFSEDFVGLSYDFPPYDDEEIFIMLHLHAIEGMDIFKFILDLFFKEFNMHKEAQQNDLKFVIKHKIVEDKKCSACEKAKKEREMKENGS